MNNAGVYDSRRSRDITEDDSIGSSTSTCWALLLTTQEAAEALRAEGRQRHQHQLGHERDLGCRTRSVYIGTKGAVDAITEVAGRGTGPAEDPRQRDQAGRRRNRGHARAGIIGSDFEKELVAATPLGRIGQPDDIAKLALTWRRMSPLADRRSASRRLVASPA